MKVLQAVLTLAIVACPMSQACLLPEEIDPTAPRIMRRHTKDHGHLIGTGDRFRNGAVAPRGLGSQPNVTNMGPILNAKEVKSAFRGLASEFSLETFEAPYKTYYHASIFGAQIGGRSAAGGRVGRQCDKDFRVFFSAAFHARERGTPDTLLYFLGDLLHAHREGTGLVYGGRSFTAAEVARAYAVGIVFVPLSNPDGLAWDQGTNSCWRKNRNPASVLGKRPETIGVDLNRNFDFLWDYRRAFRPSVADKAASTDPASPMFHGLAPASEPETKSIVWVMDQFPMLRWYMDIHAYAGYLLYNWGSDVSQAHDPDMNFRNRTYDGARGQLPDQPHQLPHYREYMPSDDSNDKYYAATRTVKAIRSAAGRGYEALESVYFTPKSGSSMDYAYSRSMTNSSLSKIHGFTLEVGAGNEDASCPFYPSEDEYHGRLLEVGAACMEFLLAAEEVGLGDEEGC